MVDIINNLYYLTLFILGVCAILLVATVGYIAGIIKYAKMHIKLIEELDKIKNYNIIHKEKI